jgi:hypothetical protein
MKKLLKGLLNFFINFPNLFLPYPSLRSPTPILLRAPSNPFFQRGPSSLKNLVDAPKIIKNFLEKRTAKR